MKQSITQIEMDAKSIEALGGNAAVARLLEYGVGGDSRVGNWKKNGVPWAVRFKHPTLFPIRESRPKK